MNSIYLNLYTNMSLKIVKMVEVMIDDIQTTIKRLPKRLLQTKEMYQF